MPVVVPISFLSPPVHINWEVVSSAFVFFRYPGTPGKGPDKGESQEDIEKKIAQMALWCKYIFVALLSSSPALQLPSRSRQLGLLSLSAAGLLGAGLFPPMILPCASTPSGVAPALAAEDSKEDDVPRAKLDVGGEVMRIFRKGQSTEANQEFEEAQNFYEQAVRTSWARLCVRMVVAGQCVD
jgi:hypothetical protein